MRIFRTPMLRASFTRTRISGSERWPVEKQMSAAAISSRISRTPGQERAVGVEDRQAGERLLLRRLAIGSIDLGAHRRAEVTATEEADVVARGERRHPHHAAPELDAAVDGLGIEAADAVIEHDAAECLDAGHLPPDERRPSGGVVLVRLEEHRAHAALARLEREPDVVGHALEHAGRGVLGEGKRPLQQGLLLPPDLTRNATRGDLPLGAPLPPRVPGVAAVVTFTPGAPVA